MSTDGAGPVVALAVAELEGVKVWVSVAVGVAELAVVCAGVAVLVGVEEGGIVVDVGVSI